MVSYVLAERKALSLSNNPFVVRLFYAFQSEDQLYLVMEYLVGGEDISNRYNASIFSELNS